MQAAPKYQAKNSRVYQQAYTEARGTSKRAEKPQQGQSMHGSDAPRVDRKPPRTSDQSIIWLRTCCNKVAVLLRIVLKGFELRFAPWTAPYYDFPWGSSVTLWLSTPAAPLKACAPLTVPKTVSRDSSGSCSGAVPVEGIQTALLRD